MAQDLQRERFEVDNHQGWTLVVKRTVSPTHHRTGQRPVLLLTGYGMNDFILGFHPQGRSMIRCLAEAGFEVWTGAMRRQRGSRRQRRRAGLPGLRAFCAEDMPRLIEGVLAHTTTGADSVDLVGSSLGGSVVYGHLAVCPDTPVGSVVAIGAPLHWEELHPAMRVLFSSERLAGWLPMVGTDRLARWLFPVVSYLPGLLSFYMNVDHIDMSEAAQLTRTVDEPDRRVNRDMVAWMRSGALVLDGVNVTEALADQTRPLLVILANRDGIVPRSAAEAAMGAWGGTDRTLVEIGDDEDWYAHADLFIAPEAPKLLFEPLAAWLRERQ